MQIKPSSFQTTEHWFETFDNMERETSARLLVKYCQHLDPENWPEFISKKALNKWAKENFWFNGLDTLGFITRSGDKVKLNPEFIAKAYSTKRTHAQ